MMQVNYANPPLVSIAAKIPPILVKPPPKAKAPTQPLSQPPVSSLAPSPTSIVKSSKGNEVLILVFRM
jgi:hypothetical protein